jgi:PST family polysaccharide transporter
LARTGAKWSVAFLIIRQFISIGTTTVIARILLPSDFGLVAMVGTLTGFLMLISDMGLSWATVQKERIEREQIDLVFWAGAVFGGLAWALCGLSGPLVARFYKSPELGLVCWVFGLGLLINGLAIQPTAMLKRQIRQRELALMQTASVLIGGAVGVGLALAGARYWALVAQNIFGGLVLLAMSLYWSGYRPAFPRLSAGGMALLKFGGYVVACNIMTFLQINLDSILIGRYCGATELGFYSRACFLRTLPATYAAMALTDVMVPALAALQGDRQRLEVAFTKAVRLVAFVGCPVAACLGVSAAESVRLIYGPQWAPVVPLLILLSFPAFVLPLLHTMGWLLVATGKVREMFLLSIPTVPLIGISYYFGIRWGARGVALAAAVIYTVPMPIIYVYFAHAAAGLSLRRTINAVLPITLSCLGAAAAAFAAGSWVALWGVSWVVVLGVKLMMAAFVYFSLAIYFVKPFPIQRLEQLAERLRRIFHRFGSQKAATG